MEEKETLWEKMFKKTPKEEEIQKRIDEEMENYKNSLTFQLLQQANLLQHTLIDCPKYAKFHIPS